MIIIIIIIIIIDSLVVHGAMGCGQKNFVTVAVPPAPVRVLIQRPLAPSVASLTSVANDKGDSRGCAQISCICLTAVENPENLS